MTNRYAVSAIDFYANELATEVVSVDTEMHALSLAFNGQYAWLLEEASTQVEAKSVAFNSDCMINVIKI